MGVAICFSSPMRPKKASRARSWYSSKSAGSPSYSGMPLSNSSFDTLDMVADLHTALVSRLLE
eukprot:3766961-Pyramimonas_sp.AAC.1